MTGRLGISVATRTVRAVLVSGGSGGRIAWAGSAAWEDSADLTEAIARLAAESGRVVRRTRVVLERDLVQLRTLLPAPPLGAAAARRYVALEAARLFRQNGAPLITDATVVAVDASRRALWAAAAPEPLLRAILAGCAEAGLVVDAIGPAAEVMPYAAQSPPVGGELTFANGGATELVTVGAGGTWRSRLVPGSRDSEAPWHAALTELNGEASHFAPAFGAAIASPRMQLLPVDTRAALDRVSRRRLLRLGAVAAALWIAAGLIYGTRLTVAGEGARRELEAHAPAVDTALAERRELGAARRTLADFAAAEGARSRHLALLAQITGALADSSFLLALQAGPDGRVRIVGYAPSAARVVASLERSGLDSVRTEGPVTREQAPGGGERERFAIVARRRSR